MRGSPERYFKTGKGEYAEGDQFMVIPNALLRDIGKNFLLISFEELSVLLQSRVHEKRLLALIILNQKQKKIFRSKVPCRLQVEKIFTFYLTELLRKRSGINNWDLIDLSAPTIIGQSLLYFESYGDKNLSFLEKIEFQGDGRRFWPLFSLARSDNLWHRRVAMCSNLTLIREGILEPTWEIASMLSTDKRDLTQKVTGWILREAGKKDEMALLEIIEKEGKHWPRTLSRSPIERIKEPLRNEILKKTRTS